MIIGLRGMQALKWSTVEKVSTYDEDRRAKEKQMTVKSISLVCMRTNNDQMLCRTVPVVTETNTDLCLLGSETPLSMVISRTILQSECTKIPSSLLASHATPSFLRLSTFDKQNSLSYFAGSDAFTHIQNWMRTSWIVFDGRQPVSCPQPLGRVKESCLRRWNQSND